MIKTKKVHISDLVSGDTVIINGEMQTVSSHHVSKSEFFGWQYKGYCHPETKGMLDVALFPKWNKGVITGYVTQL